MHIYIHKYVFADGATAVQRRAAYTPSKKEYDTHIYTCIYIYMFIFLHTYIHAYINMFLLMARTLFNIGLCIHPQKKTYVHTYKKDAHTFLPTYTYMYIYIHKYVVADGTNAVQRGAAHTPSKTQNTYIRMHTHKRIHTYMYAYVHKYGKKNR